METNRKSLSKSATEILNNVFITLIVLGSAAVFVAGMFANL